VGFGNFGSRVRRGRPSRTQEAYRSVEGVPDDESDRDGADREAGVKEFGVGRRQEARDGQEQSVSAEVGDPEEPPSRTTFVHLEAGEAGPGPQRGNASSW